MTKWLKLHVHKYFPPDLSHVTTHLVKLGCSDCYITSEMHYLQQTI